MPDVKKARSMITDRNKFVLEASKLAMHALLANAPGAHKTPEGIAQSSRKYAIALWRAMRHPIA